jgi:Actin
MSDGSKRMSLVMSSFGTETYQKPVIVYYLLYLCSAFSTSFCSPSSNRLATMMMDPMNESAKASTSLPDAPSSGDIGEAMSPAEGSGELPTAHDPEGNKLPKAKKPAKRKAPPTAVSDAASPARAPSSPKKKKNLASSAKESSSVSSKKNAPAPSMMTSPSVPASRTLVVDNGGDTVKYGWAATPSGGGGSSNDGESQSSSPPTPASMPNLTARLPQQWTILVGDQLLSQKFRNPNSLLSVTRSTERGVVTNLGNQLQVWKRMLDLLRVSIPLHTDTAKAFGWKAPSAAKSPTSHRARPASSAMPDQPQSTSTSTGSIPAGGCAVLVTVPPFCPRTVLDQVASVWLDDFGFASVGFVCSPAAAAVPCLRSMDNPYGTACVVDAGWSATHVVPTVPTSVSATSTSDREIVRGAVRRVPVGGRHLINLWKYQTTYRQWNLMDQEFLLKDVLERTGEVSLTFNEWMKLAARVPAGRRPFDREYVLPDFVQTFEGEVRLPRALLDLQERAEQRGSGNDKGAEPADVDEEEEDDDDEDDDSDVDENDMNRPGHDNDDEDMSDAGHAKVMSRKPGKDDASIGGDDEEDEETPDQIRRRLLKQKEEEERRRREEEAEQQVLNLSVERFAIPEALFRPSDVGLPAEWAGLPEAIVQSIQACPKHFQPALYRSIYLVGGLSQLPGLKERLEGELRALVPCDLDVAIEVFSDPINQAWHGARQLALDLPPEVWGLRREKLSDSSLKSYLVQEQELGLEKHRRGRNYLA